MSEKNEVLREMVREEFEAWHAIKFRGIELANRDEHSTFVNAWAMTAYLAQARENEKGHEIAKLQQRIHRQRVANKDLIERARRAEELEAKLERENAEWYGAVAALVELLTPYCWHSEDEELHAVNRLRRMVGWREQLGKDEGEAELRSSEASDEAEGTPLLPATRQQLNYLESLLENCFEEYGGGVKGWERWTGTRLSELTKAEASVEISRWSGRAA